MAMIAQTKTIPAQQAEGLQYEAPKRSQAVVSPTATRATILASFEAVKQYVSDKPLQRPKRTRPHGD